jgi:hypothetical protein
VSCANYTQSKEGNLYRLNESVKYVIMGIFSKKYTHIVKGGSKGVHRKILLSFGINALVMTIEQAGAELCQAQFKLGLAKPSVASPPPS